MLVRVIYKDGTEDIKEVLDLSQLSLVNVASYRIIASSLKAA